MSKEELPERWADALERSGVTSIRAIARKAEISPMAASRLVKGEPTSAKTVRQVAEALFGGNRNKVWELHGSALRDHGDWQLPEESSLLTDDQRAAVVGIVRAMLPPEVRGGGAGAKRAPQIKSPGSGPDPAFGDDVGLPPLTKLEQQRLAREARHGGTERSGQAARSTKDPKRQRKGPSVQGPDA